MKQRANQGDWAQQVPWIRRGRPYRDYGWDPGQSVLPEFRDPTMHFMPYEYQELKPWLQLSDRAVVYPQNLMDRAELSHLGPYTGRGPRSYKRSDERLYEEICERMMQNGNLDASDINVEVKNSEVVLTGTVSDRRAKRLAENIVNSVYSVRDVHNQLQLQEQQNTPQRWIDEVGQSGVYPVSEIQNAPKDAESQDMASWGQGDRGSEGYDDHGDSELHIGRRNQDMSQERGNT